MASESDKVLYVGQEFGSYEDLIAAVRSYERQELCKLSVDNCRTVETANKRIQPGSLEYAAKFRYSSIKMTCKHFGKFKSRSSGKRPNQRTYKTGCKVMMIASVNRARDVFVIRQGHFEHNHETSCDIYCSYPENRRLGLAEGSQAERMIMPSVPTNVVYSKLTEISGKKITRQDICNIRAELIKRPQGESVKLVLNVIDGIIRDDPTCNITIVANESGGISVIFLQTTTMNHSLCKFPEVVICDASYTVNENRMPLYTFLVEDGNGKSIPCAHALVENETKETLRYVFKLLKESGGNDLQDPNLFLVDKDFTETALLKETFPKSNVHLRLFNVLSTFRTETTDLPPNEKEEVRSTLKEMANTRTEAEYEQLLDKLKSASKEFFRYFKYQWHSMRDMWVPAYQEVSHQFGSGTNNQLEVFHEKLQVLINSDTAVAECLGALILLHKQFLREMSTHNRSPSIGSATILENCQHPDEVNAILQECTPYVADKLIDQVCRSSMCRVNAGTLSPTWESASNSYKVTTYVDEGNKSFPVSHEKDMYSCSCYFSNSMGLPCRHIFCYREYLHLPLYESTMVSKRWTKRYQQYSPDKTPSRASQVISKAVHRHVVNKSEKYEATLAVGKQIASVLSSTGHVHFHARLRQLEELLAFWLMDQEVMILERDCCNESSEVHDVAADTQENEVPGSSSGACYIDSDFF